MQIDMIIDSITTGMFFRTQFGQAAHIPEALCGIAGAAVLYGLTAAITIRFGARWIDRLMPPRAGAAGRPPARLSGKPARGPPAASGGARP